MIKNYTLDNGLRVVEDPIEGSHSFSMMVMFKTGSRNETEDIWGISHFLEHMCFKGTKSFPSANILAKELDSLGALHNASTSKEHTGYYLKASSHVFEKALNIICEITTDPIITDSEADKERGAIIEELNMYEDDPARRVGDYYEEVLYRNHQISQDIGGTKKSLNGIHAKEMIAYRNKYYRAGNAVVSIAGKIPENFKELIETRLKSLETGENKYLDGELEDRKRVNLKTKDTNQTHMILGFPGVSILDKDREVARILATLLGGNSSSRMFSEVREKRGLAYYIFSMSDNMQDDGTIATFAGVNNDRIYEAVSLISDIYDSIKEDVPEDELKKTKDYLSGVITLSYEESELRAQRNATTTLYGLKPASLEKRLEQIERVTSQDVKRLANELIDRQKICLALIGPFKDKDKFEKALKI